MMMIGSVLKNKLWDYVNVREHLLSLDLYLEKNAKSY